MVSLTIISLGRLSHLSIVDHDLTRFLVFLHVDRGVSVDSQHLILTVMVIDIVILLDLDFRDIEFRKVYIIFFVV